MKEAFDLNYARTGREHEEIKEELLKKKGLVRDVLGQLRSPSKVKHDIIEAIMAEKHKLEEKHDQVPLDAQEREEQLYLEGKLDGLDMALKIAKEIK